MFPQFTAAKNTIFLVIGIGIFLLVGYLFYSNVQLEKEVGVLEHNLDQEKLAKQMYKTSAEGLIKEIQSLSQTIVEEQTELDILYKKLEQIEKSKLEIDKKLNKAIGRQEVVWKKPTLVERMVRDSFKEYTERHSCLTGVKEKCKSSVELQF